MHAFREAYVRMDLAVVAWIHSENNPAYSLMEPKENAILDRIIDDGRAEHVIEQMFVRNPADFRHS